MLRLRLAERPVRCSFGPRQAWPLVLRRASPARASAPRDAKLSTAEEKLEAIERELKYRRRVYPRRIEAGHMTEKLAAYQLAIFEEIATDYRKQAEGERLL